MYSLNIRCRYFMFRFGWTVSLQYLITIWLDLAKDNRVLSFIKVGLILVFDECSFSECLL